MHFKVLLCFILVNFALTTKLKDDQSMSQTFRRNISVFPTCPIAFTKNYKRVKFHFGREVPLFPIIVSVCSLLLLSTYLQEMMQSNDISQKRADSLKPIVRTTNTKVN